MSSSTPTSSSVNKKKNWKASDYPYAVDYNDHFETPLTAYEDIAPLLDRLASSDRKGLTIYDPYYCHGQTVALFRRLGFDDIVNRKRDFYRDIQDDTLPAFDVLVTNPPYSDQHKKRCLDFALQQLRDEDTPFFLLMPNYVAAREYFRERIVDSTVFYLIPNQPYEYSHPEGTGKSVPPFASLWFCGIPNSKANDVLGFWKRDSSRPKLVSSLEELKRLGAIPTDKRPNPRQRKKRKQHAQQQNQDVKSTPKEQPQAQSIKKRSKKASKHRDENGQRKKKRF